MSTNNPTIASWYSRPIFISSTFNDMQAERDWLRDIVFKGISHELKGMQVDLEPVDLRWGVETKNESETEAKELLVLKCLDEIERCQPFLIILIVSGRADSSIKIKRWSPLSSSDLKRKG